MAVKPIPDGYHTATPYLTVKDAAGAIDFYKKALGATELFRMEGPDGRIGHAEIKIGNSPIMLAEECPVTGSRSPQSLGGTSMSLMIYVEDVDTVAGQVVEAGAKTLRPLANQFYGDRSITVEDPYGHIWTISTHVEDVSSEEMGKRAAEMMKKRGAA